MTCRVSYRDMDGVEHSCEVEALSMYEAAGLALARFKKCSEIKHEPGERTELTVEARPTSVVHRLSVEQYDKWFNRTSDSPFGMACRWRIREAMKK